MSDDKFLVSQRYRHPELGIIHIIVRSNARTFTARWNNNELVVSIPEYTKAETFNSIMANWVPRLLTKKPESRYFHVGQTFESALHKFVIEAGRDYSYYSAVEPEKNIVRFTMSAATPPEGDIAFNRFVNNCLDRYAVIFSKPFLINEATEFASKLGVAPTFFDISRGAKILGKCYADKHIELSRNLLFYPEELRRYVYAHELAHLTHMNHSPLFHALLDRYLDGHERRLKAALDAFRTPFIK